VAFEHTGIERRRFGSTLETDAFRLVHEALTNVARHAQVTTVTVRLWASPETLAVQVQDHGTGFDPQTLPALSSGIAGMRERASTLGGQLSIELAPGFGAQVMIEWPLSPTVTVWR
jgi:two-component system, NarL family, sensor histidine kinase DegS